jgi:AcrR family transcriptional regulator
MPHYFQKVIHHVQQIEQSNGKRARTRDSILDAAITCFNKTGIRQCNMVDIAERAGIGRSTLYRHFPKLEDVIAQAIIRDIGEVIALNSETNASFEDVEDIVVESFVFILRELPKRPVLNLLFKQDPELIHHLSLKDEAFNRLGAEFTVQSYELAKRDGRLRPGLTLEEFVEWTTRILISLASMPYEHQQDNVRIRQYLKRFLVPSLLVAPALG